MSHEGRGHVRVIHYLPQPRDSHTVGSQEEVLNGHCTVLGAGSAMVSKAAESLP
jgi:hypothetical protein